jgi:hypothetical protein
MQPGDTFSYVFTEQGQFPYGCTMHPTMNGIVYVAGAAFMTPGLSCLYLSIFAIIISRFGLLA